MVKDQGAAQRDGGSYKLTPEEIESFTTNGFVHLKVIDSSNPSLGFPIRRRAERAGKRVHGVSQGWREVLVVGRDFCDMSAAYSKPLEEFSIINILLNSKYRPYLRGSLDEQRAASVAEQLQGADMVFYYDQLLAKVPRKADGVFHWHQGLAYWPVTKDTRTASFWLAIDDSNMENGCIQFVPGSHSRLLPPELTLINCSSPLLGFQFWRQACNLRVGSNE